MAQYISIAELWSSTRFHCPACGAEVYNDSGEPTTNPCSHLLFSWIDQVGEFDNASEEVRAFLEEDDGLHHPCDEAFLERLPETAVLFSLESCGMACGPVSFAIIHAIKFPEDSDED